jgi:hypothetical protein
MIVLAQEFIWQAGIEWVKIGIRQSGQERRYQ